MNAPSLFLTFMKRLITASESPSTVTELHLPRSGVLAPRRLLIARAVVDRKTSFQSASASASVSTTAWVWWPTHDAPYITLSFTPIVDERENRLARPRRTITTAQRTLRTKNRARDMRKWGQQRRARQRTTNTKRISKVLLQRYSGTANEKKRSDGRQRAPYSFY